MERMRRSRRALFAGVLAVAGLQAYLDIGIDGGRLDWADAEYGTTVRHLEQRKREYPNRPVVVMLGLSRSKPRSPRIDCPKRCPAMRTRRWCSTRRRTARTRSIFNSSCGD